jgi:hypothetical protein
MSQAVNENPTIEEQTALYGNGKWFGYMQCFPCGYVTRDSRARSCCKGYCQDASGKSCNAWPCPNCGALHSWTGSVAEDYAHDDPNRASP